MVTSDRISAYDVVMPTRIPDKGRVLTGLSAHWFAETRGSCRTTSCRPGSPTCRPRCATPSSPGARWWSGASRCWRSSAWYAATSPAAGGATTATPARCAATGSRPGSARPRPCPSRSSRRRPRRRKATTRTSPATTPPTSSARTCSPRRSAISIALYRFAAERCARAGIILADTKFELGTDHAGRLVLGDEAVTPDSSRFWPADEHALDTSPPSFDKQYLRDWLDRERLEPHPTGARASRRRRRRHPQPLPRGVPAHHRPRHLRLDPGVLRMSRVIVTVMPRAETLDPQGQAVAGALHQLGFDALRRRAHRQADRARDRRRRPGRPGPRDVRPAPRQPR